MAFTTCLEMFGNGLKIVGIVVTQVRQKMVLHGSLGIAMKEFYVEEVFFTPQKLCVMQSVHFTKKMLNFGHIMVFELLWICKILSKFLNPKFEIQAHLHRHLIGIVNVLSQFSRIVAAARMITFNNFHTQSIQCFVV